jgi:hypothetical protein
MNAQVILSNLREAEEQLRSLISQAEQRPEFSFESFHIGMAHLYHHLNTAWNARNATRDQWVNQAEEDFKRWEQFPNDLPLIGSDTFYDLPEYRDTNDA